MKRFRFRLQSVLDFARHEEERAEMQLHALMADKAEAQRQLADVRGKQRQSEDTLARSKEIYPHEMSLYRRFIDACRRDAFVLERRIHAIQQDVVRKRKEFVQKTQKRKTLDRLRDRRKANHDQERDRLLQQESDDLHLTRLRR